MGELVGRQVELHAVEQAVDGLAAGRGGVLLITGDGGMGKSALCDHLASIAADRVVSVRWGRCPESPGAPPFWPWRSVVEPWPVLGDEDDRFELFERVAAALAVDAPVAVIVEDLHWADDSSLRLLAHLAPIASRSSVLLVATYREGASAVGGPLDDVIGACAAHATTVALRPLSADDIAGLAEGAIGVGIVPAWLDRIADHSGGNPFHALQLIRHLAAQGRLDHPPGDGPIGVPPGVANLLRRRLRAQSTESQDVLAVAAVIGREVDLDLLRRVRSDATTAVEEACAAGLLHHEPGTTRFRFLHALVREVIVEDLPALERADIHAAVAAALAEQPAPGRTPATRAALAHHSLAGAVVLDAGVVVGRVLDAADEAARALAHEEVVRLTGAALALEPAAPDRYELLLRRGRALFHVDRHEESTDALADAAEIAERDDDLARMAAALLAIGAGRLLVPDRRGIDAALQRAADRASDAPALQAVLRSRRADFVAGVALGGRRADVEPLLRGALELARRSGDADAYAVVAGRLFLHGCAWMSRAERSDLVQELCRLRARVSHESRVNIAAIEVRHRLEEGDLGGAASLAGAAGTEDAFSRSSASMRLAEQIAAVVALERGDLDRTEVLVQQLSTSPLGTHGGSEPILMMLLVERDQCELLAGMVEDLLVRDPGPLPLALPVALALALAEADRHDEARVVLDRVAADDLGAVAEGWGGVGLGLVALAVHAAHRVGHVAVAERALPALEAVRDRNVVQGMLPVLAHGAGSHFTGLCRLTLGDVDSAVADLEDALAANRAMGAVPWVARGHEALARAHLLAGDGTRAFEHARSSLELARGARLPLAERRAAELVEWLGGEGASGVEAGTVTIVFTDIVDSTARTAAMGDEAWHELFEAHLSTVRALAARNGGRIVKSLGDGFMLVFAGARSAVDFAQELRRSGAGFPVRIGVHTGEAVARDGDFLGHHVNLAARVSAAASSGEVLLSAVSHAIVSTSGDLRFGPPRPRKLKGIDGEQLLHPLLD